MSISRSKACGIDVHKRFLMAAVLERNGHMKTEKFQNSLEQLHNIRDGLSQKNVRQ